MHTHKLWVFGLSVQLVLYLIFVLSRLNCSVQ